MKGIAQCNTLGLNLLERLLTLADLVMRVQDALPQQIGGLIHKEIHCSWPIDPSLLISAVRLVLVISLQAAEWFTLGSLGVGTFCRHDAQTRPNACEEVERRIGEIVERYERVTLFRVLTSRCDDLLWHWVLDPTVLESFQKAFDHRLLSRVV